MRNSVMASALAAALLLGGCSKDKPSAPQTPDFTLVTSAAIGTGGGELATDDFALIVPADAFSEPVTLELSVSEKILPFGAEGVSKTYRIGHLPATYSSALRLRVKIEDSLTLSGYVAIGHKTMVSGLDTAAIAYFLQPAIDSGGFLICELPAPDPEQGLMKVSDPTGYTTGEDLELIMRAVNRPPAYVSAEGHFRITYPQIFSDAVAPLAADFEDAFDSIRALGFSYAGRTRWPVQVTVRDLGTGFGGLYMHSIWGDNYGCIEIHETLRQNRSGLRATAAHEFMHLAQDLYDSRNRISKSKFHSEHYWLNEGVSTWVEGKLMTDPNYLPGPIVSREMAPFRGMHAGISVGTATHGYGMAGLVKYLLTRFGQQNLISVYENIRSGSHPVSAIDATFGPSPQWYEEFLRDYLQGRLYPVALGTFLASSSGDYLIAGAADTLRNFPDSYPDLSARLYTIRLLNRLDSTATMSFVAAAGQLTIFKYRADGSVEFLTSGSPHVDVMRPRSLGDSGWGLVAMLTNTACQPPYTNPRTIALTMTVSKPTELSFNRCYMDGDFIAHMMRQDSSQYTVMINPTIINPAPGHFAGNTFTAEWDTTYDWGSSKGSITATIDAIARKISTYSAVDTTYRADLAATTAMRIEITGLPFDVQAHRGDAEGAAACQFVTLFERRSYGSYWSLQVQSIECDTNCGVAVLFDRM